MISWVGHQSKEVLRKVEEGRNFLRVTARRQKNWMGHVGLLLGGRLLEDGMAEDMRAKDHGEGMGNLRWMTWKPEEVIKT